MNKTISSPLIRPIAMAFAIIWIPGFGAVSLLAFMPGVISETPGIIVMPIAWVIGTVAILTLILNWTTVVLTDTGIDVTRRWTTVSVPFNEIANVTGGWHSGSFNDCVVHIQLHHATKLGSIIHFHPDFNAPFQAHEPHPIVQELKSRAMAQPKAAIPT